MNNNRLFLYGVPGVGKTHDAQLLGHTISVPVFEADEIKGQMRKKYSRQEEPFLYVGSCLAYKRFGRLNSENAIHGLCAVRDALRSPVLKLVQMHQTMILEGAFLDPTSLLPFGMLTLLVARNEQRHKQQFLHHREKMLDIFGLEFQAARMIQEFLIQEAQRLGIKVVDLGDRNEYMRDIGHSFFSIKK